MWRKRIKQLSSVMIILFIALAGLGLIYMQQKGAKLLSVQSGSMVPAFKKGDLVAVRDVPPEELRVGDVITFVNSKKQMITHRVTATPGSYAGNRFITQGDANKHPDDPISSTKIVGRVERDIPYAGYATDFIRKPYGLLLLIYLPALLVVIGEIRRLTAHYKSMRYVLPLAARRGPVMR